MNRIRPLTIVLFTVGVLCLGAGVASAAPADGEGLSSIVDTFLNGPGRPHGGFWFF
ncbi:hypothetical protein ACSNOI_24190 [Actinomadura kijaniata]|uniref:hypothetical protein n=1 Tax=Actinomadura kijaniata TaxID=46161 RepID=UPI003F1A2D72